MTGISSTQFSASSRSSLESLGSHGAKAAGLDLMGGASHQTSDTTHLQDDFAILSIDGDSPDARKPIIPFEGRQCLFCKVRSVDLEENLEHMLKVHGLFIPDRPHLVVELETLIEYFHLVIFGYFECLYCGSQRRNYHAIQQHMVGKGHCKIDIDNEDSEFRDFYDFDSTSTSCDSDSDNDAESTELRRERSKAPFVDIDKSLRLPSGKLLSHRIQGKPRLHRQVKGDEGSPSTSSIRQSPTSLDASYAPTNSAPDHGPSPDSKRLAKREATFLNQLASLRAEDRASLMHLPVWKQRALILESKRNVEKARRDENKMLLKIQLKANP